MPANGVWGIARSAVITLIEGQKSRGRSGQLGRHAHSAVTHSKVNQRPGEKRQQRFGGLALLSEQPVKAVLIDSILHRLGEICFQLDGGNWQAVQKEYEVKRSRSVIEFRAFARATLARVVSRILPCRVSHVSQYREQAV